MISVVLAEPPVRVELTTYALRELLQQRWLLMACAGGLVSAGLDALAALTRESHFRLSCFPGVTQILTVGSELPLCIGVDSGACAAVR